ncbi:hypothetical protein C8J55DRAFT_501693 [Lentinula edodes]|uniref:Riboflavin kinase n=1 Tax=Lentinula lateritia TaxID=40482 RepID=A0A9W9DZB6_9AGAR|nr:hypothetical protein C8J55DRAFT_501693 [Lentinula edodes]
MVAQSESQSTHPPALNSTASYRISRPLLVGPSSPIYPGSPYPIRLQGPVCKGFGRGGKDLGCPTANLPDDDNGGIGTGVQEMRGKVDTGVFYGFAKVIPPSSNDHIDHSTLPMVMSLGWNPFYKNERLTAEIHILHEFENDFYGYDMKVLVLGYIRPELDYVSREALIEDIDTDKRVALNCLARPDYARFAEDEFFVDDKSSGVQESGRALNGDARKEEQEEMTKL